MAQSVAQRIDPTEGQRDRALALERPARELLLFRLSCAQTANGLSHYYMYGDVAPEATLL